MTVKGCRHFARMVNFLRIFCPELQRLLKPIYDLTRKDRQFVWEEQQLSFEEKLVQKSLLKQADIDKMLKIIQRKVLKGTHLPATVKEIQAGYLISPYFKDLFHISYSISVENFNIVGREDQNLKRAIKEALYIRVNNPSLNRNVGKYHLPHIWDEVLYNIPELKLK